MPGVVFDTNIWIAYKPTNLPKNLVMSAVVLQELVAGASDGTVLKSLEVSRKQYEKEGKLLVPTGEDWYRAGKILNSFLHNLKAHAGVRLRGCIQTRFSKCFATPLSRCP